MRRGGTVRGMFAAWLGLIALHAVGTQGGSGRISQAFADISGLIERALDADVPAIPDRRAGVQSEAAAGVEAGRAAGGLQQGTSDRFGGRLPIPDPPK